MRISTDHPLADWSPDHTHPKGAATDSTRHAGFNAKLAKLIPEPRLLDFGCAGGGLVASIIEDGGFAAGIDGSDYNQKHNRSEWAKRPESFFLADLTHPFILSEDDEEKVAEFDVVTAWEVLEHIPAHLVPAVMNNAAVHLAPWGFFICSISRMPDRWAKHDYHATVKSRDWWLRTFADLGWDEDAEMFEYFDPDWVRGPANGMNSFPLVLRKAPCHA